MNKTKIEWCNFTWNPIVGCKHNCTKKTMGFDCYAKVTNDRFKFIEKWDEPQFFIERIHKTELPRKPSIIFVGSMADMFGEWIDEKWIEEIIRVVRRYPEHIFMFLTKNPKRYLKFNFPKNVMLGATITSTNEYVLSDSRNYISSLRILKSNGWKVFFSIEPLLDVVKFNYINFADLIIIGADTSRNPVIPKDEWIYGISSEIGKKVFIKDNLAKYYPNFINISSKEQIWELFK